MRLSANTLYDLYWGLGYSLNDVSRITGVNDMQVLKSMRRYGIPRRAPHGASPRTERKIMKGMVVRDRVLAERLGLVS